MRALADRTERETNGKNRIRTDSTMNLAKHFQFDSIRFEKIMIRSDSIRHEFSQTNSIRFGFHHLVKSAQKWMMTISSVILEFDSISFV